MLFRKLANEMSSRVELAYAEPVTEIVNWVQQKGRHLVAMRGSWRQMRWGPQAWHVW
jgi:hypothetical protein